MPHTASTQAQTATQHNGLRLENRTHSPATAEATDQAHKLKAVPLSPPQQSVPNKLKAPGRTAPTSATPNASTNHDPTIRLAWPHRIRWTRHALSIDNPTLAQAFVGEPHTSAHANDQANAQSPSSRCLAFVDEGVLACHPGLPEQLATYLNHHRESEACQTPELVACIPLPGGETVKDGMTHILPMLEAMQQHGIDRHSHVLAIGGGALLDAVGFAASIAHRGVRLIRMPTTSLAQCDSGVGVKNAVNLLGEKNFAGSFQVPWAIVNDLAFLETLPLPVWRQGWSEVVKVALLKDAGLYATLESQALDLSARNAQAAEPFWQASAKLHIDHIALGGDPFEAQRARPLDFGHWSAHRLEQLSNHALSHGDAVAIGLAIDMAYAANIGLVDPALTQSVHRLLETLGFDLWHPIMANPQAILDGLESFRQHLGGQLTITMVQAPGQPIDLHHIDHHKMAQAITSLAPAPGSAPER